MNNAVAYLSSLLTAAQGRLAGDKDRGATAVEYGLLVGLIAVAIIATVGLLGGTLDGLFSDVEGQLPGGGAGGEG